MVVKPFPATGEAVQYEAVQYEAVRYQTAGLLQHTYRWMRAASEVTPTVTGAAPALTAAVHLYNAEQYPAALRQVSGVVSMLHQARQAYPALPPL